MQNEEGNLLLRSAFCILTSAFFLTGVRAAELPAIPVGADAFLQWDHWPMQRIGERAYMRSTYDRRGGNEGADASHFLYQLADDQNVALDLEGAGELVFARYNHWHGSPWHYMVDGRDTIVRESSTKDPLHPVENSTFEPGEAFPPPLALTWSQTRGADLSWVPVAFEKSFRMAYGRTHYGTGYYIYHRFVPGTKLSQPLKSWTADSLANAGVLKLMSRVGDDMTSDGSFAMKTGDVDVPAGKMAVLTSDGEEALWETTSGLGDPIASCIRTLLFAIPRSEAADRLRLRITWDRRDHASVDVPLTLFFGSGTFYNRDNREWLVKSMPVSVCFDASDMRLCCQFPMPFERSAKIELINDGDRDCHRISWAVRFEAEHERFNRVSYFHATYRDFPMPERGKDLVLLDTREVEGGGDWSGSFVGTSFIFSHDAVLNTLEGDPRFFFDDAESPQAQGTGTEEWGGGGDYWGGKNMTLPFAGHPCGAPSAKQAKCDADKIESAYRFLLSDLFPFGKNARICLEHGGTNESKAHYETVTYWYGLPAASVVKTDSLQIGETASEKSHAYVSSEASAPYSITSRFELGVDHLGADEINPATTDTGRSTTGTSEFTLKLTKANLGVMLRRKLDYQFPNQRAEVFVADADEGEPEWKPAGVWYLAGSNTCVYSNPKDELGVTQHVVETSNRRFREDEFLIGRDLTKGREAIRVRIQFTPVKTPLFPGQALPALAWSEIRYDAYCFVMPNFSLKD